MELATEQVLFYMFIFIVGVCLFIPAFMVKRKVFVYTFTLLSAMTFIFLAFQVSEYTILMLIFIAIALIQFITLIAIRGEN